MAGLVAGGLVLNMDHLKPSDDTNDAHSISRKHTKRSATADIARDADEC